MFFLNSGEALFGVTARHVYADYRNQAQDRCCQIGDLQFEPTIRLIDEDIEFDIATFRIKPNELELIRKGVNSVPWPPMIPSEGALVALAGLPGQLKGNPEPFEANWLYYLAVFKVSSVSDKDVSMVKPPDQELTDLFGKGLPPPSFDIGGMSGGPVVLLQENPSGLLSWSISGVIYEGLASYDIIKAKRADVILGDGTLKR